MTEVPTRITPRIIELLRRELWDSQAEAVSVLRAHKKRRAAEELAQMSQDEFEDFVTNAVDD